MEEILQNLIKTTHENGPQNKQFYSNLSITKPIHDHVEIQSRLHDAANFLQSSFSPEGGGYQSKFYTSRNCAIEWERVSSAFNLPNNVAETLTSVIALDLLFNRLDNSGTTCFQQSVVLPFEIQDALQDFIVPSLGLETFNLFKNLELPSPSSSEPIPAGSQISGHDSDEIEEREDVDSGNDSPTSMQPLPIQNDSEALFPVEDFPDDLNTTALTLSVLLHQGVLQPKPAESVVQWLISNILQENAKEETGEVEEEASASTRLSSTSSISDRALIEKGQDYDPVSISNLLHLIYSLDISHEMFLSAIEEFLVVTLKNTITAESSLQAVGSSRNVLGNPPQIISSDMSDNEHNNEWEEKHNEKMNKEVEQVNFFLNHHSPDSFLYFLSRCLATVSTTSNSSARPHVNEMKGLLLELLDLRLGTTMDTCDLAMRILAGVYLDAVLAMHPMRSKNKLYFDGNNSKNYISTSKYLRINNLLQKEFELLVSLQSEVDGSWPADSIFQVGLSSGQSCTRSKANNEVGDGDGEDCLTENNHMEDSSVYGVSAMEVGFLGSKEISTMFAVKAISTFLSAKKHEAYEDGVSSSEEEDEYDGREGHLELHHLY